MPHSSVCLPKCLLETIIYLLHEALTLNRCEQLFQVNNAQFISVFGSFLPHTSVIPFMQHPEKPLIPQSLPTRENNPETGQSVYFKHTCIFKKIFNTVKEVDIIAAFFIIVQFGFMSYRHCQKATGQSKNTENVKHYATYLFVDTSKKSLLGNIFYARNIFLYCFIFPNVIQNACFIFSNVIQNALKTLLLLLLLYSLVFLYLI